MGAITPEGEGEKARLNPRRCIGCGLCVSTCPVKARVLKPKAGEPSIPYADTAEQFTQIVKNRGTKEVPPSNVISFGFERAGGENRGEKKR